MGLIELLVLLGVVALVVVILCRTLWAHRRSRGFDVLPPARSTSDARGPEAE
jgi:hypothetical protein